MEQSQASSAGPTAASSANPLLEEARLAAEQAAQPPIPIDFPPLAAPAQPDKHIIAIISDNDAAAQVIDAAVDAAEVLGWTVDVVANPVEPVAYINAIQQAVQKKPDGIILDFPGEAESIQDGLDELEASGIPWVSNGGSASMEVVDPSKGHILHVAGLVSQTAQTTAMADWIAADSNGTANIAYFTNDTIYHVVGAQEALEKELARVCPGCTLSEKQEMALADIGTNFPGQVVSYMQTHPEADYIWLPFGASTLGVAQALKAAGLRDQAKIVTFSGGAVAQQELADGDISAVTAAEFDDAGWRDIDALVRQFNGEPVLGVDEAQQFQILTQENVGDPTVPWSTPDLEGNFKRIWGVG